ncbi:putative replication factor c subunit 1 protein [Botrytis fragariae]|uniref:Putative replication factor c subunit 1 protein n=1 Tax=Botrytis fragariae TaxID=1964551 RepID=A0A8H6AWK7_9HELO|nr:putative replication factor c subunit 1 protein [Botrytis fragariae]KAF5874903.1 putative replication factor c subunit 1 protein [Botrytis fragariae]
MATPANGSVGVPPPKPKMTAAQKKKAEKEELLQEESRQERERKQAVQESVQIDRDAKAKEDEKKRSGVGLIFNDPDRIEVDDYWLAHQALQSGKSEQLSKEQAALAVASKQDHMAQHTDGSAKQNTIDRHGELSMQQSERPPAHQSTSAQAEDLMQGTGQESDQSMDDQFFDAPTHWNPNRRTDASTLQDKFQQSNVSMKHQKLQTDDIIKTSTDVTKYGKPWAGSAEELSQIWIILNDSPVGVDTIAYATLASAQVRYAELKLCCPAYLQIMPLHLRGGNTTILEKMRDLDLQKAREILENNPLGDLPASEPKAVEAAPADWADREDETFLDLNHTKKKRKPRRKALPKIEDHLSEIEEVKDADAPAQAPVKVVKPRAKNGSAAKAGEVDSEAIEDDAVVVAGAVEVPKKAVKPRAKGKAAAKAVEVDSEAIGDDETIEAPAQAPVKVAKPRAGKKKAADTIEVVPEVANNDEDVQGPVEAPRKLRKPRAKKIKAVNFVEIGSEADNDDDDDDDNELEVPKNPSKKGKSQVPAVKKPAAKPRAVAKKAQAQGDEDEDDDVPTMTKSRPVRSRAASKAVVVIDSDDDDDQEGQAKINKNKPAARQVATKSQKKAETEVPEHIKTLLNNTGTFLAGRTFVVSGTLPTVGRINIEKLSRLYGGKTSRAITKATTDVILGENPLAKQVKELKELSPNTMNVDEFIAMLMSLSNDNNNPVGADDGNAAVDDDGDGDDGEEEIEDQPPAKRTKLAVGLSSGSSALA